ncbi:MAG: helix-turn-helix transcriptional regulator [Oscillospiraceae bacterium]|nr:helix-turn-helix transcriptional regulator [Oscillospiraceae bacterium]
MEFSDKLKELRMQKGISQAKLARDIHISRSAVAKWENGLGLPSEDSLNILSEYFEINVSELLPNKNSEESLVSKNKTIKIQKNIITGLLIVCVTVFLIWFCYNFEQLKNVFGLFGLGVIFIILGIFNMKGNIASVHWYNRRKVTKENQKAYCMVMGLGTLIIGISLFISGIVQAFIGIEAGAFIILIGVLAGFALMLFAQIKYNKGIF